MTMRDLTKNLRMGALLAVTLAVMPAGAQEVTKEKSQTRPINTGGSRLAEYANPATLYEPSKHGFSQIAISPQGARLVFVAGQMGIDAKGNVPEKDFEGQVRTAFQNLRLALEGAGSSIDYVLEVRLMSVDHTQEKENVIAAVTNQTFPGPNKPASMLIPVPRLALDGLLFEIGAIGYIPPSAGP